MSESKTPRSDAEESKARNLYEQQREVDWPPFDSSPYDFARTLESELNEAREMLRRIGYSDHEIDNITSLQTQLTTAQQDLAKIANALRTQQQRYHDLSEEVDGLKKGPAKKDKEC